MISLIACRTRVLITIIFTASVLFVVPGLTAQKQKMNVTETDASVTIERAEYTVSIKKDGFRYRFQHGTGTTAAPAHPKSGLQMGPNPDSLSNVTRTRILGQSGNDVSFEVHTNSGIRANVRIQTRPHSIRMQVKPITQKPEDFTIIGRTGGISPAYGLADHGTFKRDEGKGLTPRTSTDVTGFTHDHMQLGNRLYRSTRMTSNFVIAPQAGFATVNIEPRLKVVRVTEEEWAQGSRSTRHMDELYYFIGGVKDIYRAFLDARNATGNLVMKPKYDFFGVGWEAWGALRLDTSQKTVSRNVSKYTDLGFPIEWMVVGSGFWPKHKSELEGTTSFGMWNKNLYPTPRAFIKQFHEKGIKFLIGLRTLFTVGGPYSEDGLEKGYFVQNEDGEPRIWKKPALPRHPSYLLDSTNPDAVEWYVNLYQKWEKYGIDGYKEDVDGEFKNSPGVNRDGVRDDVIDYVNRAMMDRGEYVMVRNNYLGSPGDIHRINDFNYNQSQDRGPINALGYAYSGVPNVYPDVVGGATGNNPSITEKKRSYYKRQSIYAALHPAMSFGYGPWNLGDKVLTIAQDAAQLHDRLQPHFYSNAVKAYKTGFPYPMTPMPLAFPGDPDVYGLANQERRSYQWMIGESLLATPLYGDDYHTAERRNVYLPEGKWLQYETGTVYEGPRTLENYPLQIDKTPLFVGGTGIVVEDIDGTIMGRVYPITDQSQTVIHHKDGNQSEITIDQPNWEDPQVVNERTGKPVSGEWNRHAYQFPLKSGHNYRVK